jgi:predicted metal-binding protein/2-polyprenyl-3-methyl-5-hydroxy-6-metoxy-1,4-benzoquinol methylase
MKILPSDNSYRTFCELANGYRLFRVLSEAVNSGVIDLLEQEARSISELLATLALEPEAGQRFICLLVNVGLLEEYGASLSLSRFSRTFLSRQSASSQRHVIQFEPLLMDTWSHLGTLLHDGQGALLREQTPQGYRERLELFQHAMGEAARVRSRELWDAITLLPPGGTIIDIGAGDGTYLREFLARQPEWQGIACDLEDVCTESATSALPDNLTLYPCNILDPQELARLVATWRGKADLLLFSNICHCYGPEENRNLLQQTAPLLAPDGLLVVHDFFRDANSYGAMYDLHMLVNTYNGRCYSVTETAGLLQSAGFPHYTVVDLPSDSLALVASRTTPYPSALSLATLKSHALTSGFFAVVELDPATIRSEAWVRAKCSYGCAEYGKRWSCPPHSMDQAGFAELLGCYSRALLVAGQPPLRDFQEQLLALEKEAFLAGFAKALVLSGGPCCCCEACPPEGCRHPEKRRPSLESCGCDVFALARSCGLPLVPLKSSDDFVQYIGLLLVD